MARPQTYEDGFPDPGTERDRASHLGDIEPCRTDDLRLVLRRAPVDYILLWDGGRRAQGSPLPWLCQRPCPIDWNWGWLTLRYGGRRRCDDRINSLERRGVALPRSNQDGLLKYPAGALMTPIRGSCDPGCRDVLRHRRVNPTVPTHCRRNTGSWVVFPGWRFALSSNEDEPRIERGSATVVPDGYQDAWGKRGCATLYDWSRYG